MELLAEASCADCGLRDVIVLEFDHVGAKREGVAALIRSARNRARLLEEIAQCEIVCVNCHRRRTATRGGWFRATGRPASCWTAAQLRNHRYLLAVLRSAACADCGESDPVVLEFDHRGEKRGNVSSMADWASLETLETEIAKCDVRCGNCHRRKTQRALRSYRVAAVESASPP